MGWGSLCLKGRLNSVQNRCEVPHSLSWEGPLLVTKTHDPELWGPLAGACRLLGSGVTMPQSFPVCGCCYFNGGRRQGSDPQPSHSHHASAYLSLSRLQALGATGQDVLQAWLSSFRKDLEWVRASQMLPVQDRDLASLCSGWVEMRQTHPSLAGP